MDYGQYSLMYVNDVTHYSEHIYVYIWSRLDYLNRYKYGGLTMYFGKTKHRFGVEHDP